MRRREQDIGASDGMDDEDEEVKKDEDDDLEEGKMNFITKLYEDEKFQKEKVLLE